MADHGFKVAVYNRTTAKTEAFVAENPANIIGPGGALVPSADLKDFVVSIKAPRRIILLVKAGMPTDATIDGLKPLLSKGDVVIDGGNAEWEDTVRREAALGAMGLHFVGSGVSGGEEGARFGPSLMPGGKPEAWAMLKPVWEAIAAKVDAKTASPSPARPPASPSPAACLARRTSARAARGTTSRCAQTASSTATCSSSARPTTSCATCSARATAR